MTARPHPPCPLPDGRTFNEVADAHDRNAHRLLERLPPPAGLTVIDLGCGYGGSYDWALPARRYIGLDSNRLRLSRLRLLLRQPEHAVVIADLDRPPLHAATADVLICLGLLEYLTDPHTFVRQLPKLLRPGGCGVLCFPATSGLFLCTDLVHRILQQLHAAWALLPAIRFAAALLARCLPPDSGHLLTDPAALPAYYRERFCCSRYRAYDPAHIARLLRTGGAVVTPLANAGNTIAALLFTIPSATRNTAPVIRS